MAEAEAQLWRTILDGRVPDEDVVRRVRTARSVRFLVEGSAIGPNFALPPGFLGAPPYPLLFAAVARGSSAAVCALLDRGADADNTDSAHNTALLLAAALPNPSVVDALCAARADVSARNVLGQTPLLVATERLDTTSCFEVVEVLVNRRADPFARDARGRCAFDVACRFQHRGMRAYAYLLFLRARSAL